MELKPWERGSSAGVVRDPFPIVLFRGVYCRYLTFLLPPVRVTLTKRRVYTSLFLARPLGTFFFSCGSTLGV